MASIRYTPEVQWTPPEPQAKLLPNRLFSIPSNHIRTLQRKIKAQYHKAPFPKAGHDPSQLLSHRCP
jgi:hypothetical protein